MLSRKPASLRLVENGCAVAFPVAPIADVRVGDGAAVARRGTEGRRYHAGWSRADGYRCRACGAEVQALTPPKLDLQSARQSSRQGRESWFVLNVPQNGPRPRPIGIQASGISPKSYVTIAELPSNGTVLLARRDHRGHTAANCKPCS